MVRSRGHSHPDRLWEMRRPNALVGFAATGNAVTTGHHSICWPTGAMPTGSRRGLQSPLEAQSPPDILSTYHSSGLTTYCCCFTRNNPAHTTMLPNKLIPDRITQMNRACTQRPSRVSGCYETEKTTLHIKRRPDEHHTFRAYSRSPSTHEALLALRFLTCCTSNGGPTEVTDAT